MKYKLCSAGVTYTINRKGSTVLGLALATVVLYIVKAKKQTYNLQCGFFFYINKSTVFQKYTVISVTKWNKIKYILLYLLN